MLQNVVLLVRSFSLNARDMLPIIAVIAAFQYLVIQQPFEDVAGLLLGMVLVLVGLTLFIEGMSMSLFSLGESIVSALAYRANIWLLAAFAFCIGAGSTIAEPALISVTHEAAQAAFHGAGDAEIQRSAMLLRTACAMAVGIAVTVGMFFVVKGWPTVRLVLAGYGLSILVAYTNPTPMTAIALDAGASATSAINIPLISAMGVGLANMIKGRNPMLDGFGLVALCSVTPTLVLLIGARLLM